jgi:flagellar FliL protein
MAEKEVQLAQPAGSSKKPLIIGVAVALLLVGGGAAAYLAGAFGGHGASAGEAHATAVRPEPIYVAIDPPFTVNLQGAGPTRYLQTSVEALTRDPGVETALRRHLPVIRNSLLMLFSSKEARDLATLEGKESLRAAALESIQKVLQTETGQANVEDVFFTSFVMQ